MKEISKGVLMEIYITLAVALIVIVLTYKLFKAQNNTLSEQVAKLQNDLNASQKEAGRAGELEKNYNEEKAKNQQLSQKIEEMHRLLSDAEKDKTKISEQKEALKKIQEQQEINFNTMQKAAESKFKEIASTLLTQKTEELKNNGNEIAGKITPLINPLNENLNNLRDKLASMEHLNQNLQKEASNLANALKGNNKVQGDFGEMLLEQLFESCGLKEGVHFSKQVAIKNEENKSQRPDFIINLPNGRYLVVDSKMSLTAYTDYVNAPEGEKATYLAKHIESIEKHIDELSKKKYQELKGIYKHSPDFVVMYMPIEQAYLCALEKEHNLGVFASGQKVMIATASSLIPILTTIENLWNIYLTQKHTEEILKLGKTIHEKVTTFSEEFYGIKTSLNAALNHYKKAKGTFDGSGGLVSKAKELEEYGAKGTKQLPEIDYDSDLSETDELPSASNSTEELPLD